MTRSREKILHFPDNCIKVPQHQTVSSELRLAWCRSLALVEGQGNRMWPFGSSGFRKSTSGGSGVVFSPHYLAGLEVAKRQSAAKRHTSTGVNVIPLKNHKFTENFCDKICLVENVT
jgi:hypothetical protein